MEYFIKHIAVVTCLCFYTNTLIAEIIDVSSNFSSTRIDPYAYILEDTSKSWNVSDVILRNDDFRINTGPSLNFAYANSFFWIRFDLTNTTDSDLDLILEVDNPHINKLQLYTLKDSILTESILTGDNLPFAQRPISHPHFLFPIDLKSRSNITYYLWVDKHGEQIQAPLRLMTLSSYNSYNSQIHSFWGLATGITFIFSLLSLFIFLFNPQKLTFYFWAYSFFVLAFNTSHTGLAFQYFWPESTWWQSAARPTLTFGMYISVLLFTREFFQISFKRKFLNYYTLFLLGGIVFLFLCLWSQHPLLGIFENYWYHPIYYEGSNLLLFSKTLSPFILLVLVSILSIGIYEFIKERKIESLWFSLSFLLWVIGAMSILLIFAGILPDNLITKNIPLLSNSLETVILLLLLGNRLNRIRKDNERMSIQINNQKLAGAQRLFEGQLQERKRLSQQLHDGMNLTLSNIRLRLSLLVEQVNDKKEELKSLVNDLGIANQDLRQFSHALSPTIFDKYGLVDGMEELIDQTGQAHPKLDLVFDKKEISEDDIPEFMLRSLYQIFQELLSNILKHSGATIAHVELEQSYDKTILKVSDNGKGYDYQLSYNGIGLKNIESRVQLVNGTFEVLSDSLWTHHTIKIPQETKSFS